MASLVRHMHAFAREVRLTPQEWLAAHGVDTLVFAGCNLPNCPRASIIEAHERDYRVVLVTDAVSQATAQGLREIAGIGTAFPPSGSSRPQVS